MKIYKSIFFICLLSIFLFPIYSFADTYSYCINNTTLIKISEVNIKVPELGVERTINSTENEICQYGCDMLNNKCFDSPAKNWFFLIIGIIGMILAIWIIWGFSGRG